MWHLYRSVCSLPYCNPTCDSSIFQGYAANREHDAEGRVGRFSRYASSREGWSCWIYPGGGGTKRPSSAADPKSPEDGSPDGDVDESLDEILQQAKKAKMEPQLNLMQIRVSLQYVQTCCFRFCFPRVLWCFFQFKKIRKTMHWKPSSDGYVNPRRMVSCRFRLGSMKNGKPVTIWPLPANIKPATSTRPFMV